MDVYLNDDIIQANEASNEKKEIVVKIIEFLKIADTVLGAKERYVSGGKYNYYACKQI